MTPVQCHRLIALPSSSSSAHALFPILFFFLLPRFIHSLPYKSLCDSTSLDAPLVQRHSVAATGKLGFYTSLQRQTKHGRKQCDWAGKKLRNRLRIDNSSWDGEEEMPRFLSERRTSRFLSNKRIAGLEWGISELCQQLTLLPSAYRLLLISSDPDDCETEPFSFLFSLTELEATEVCRWLRATGFPQYAQMYEGKKRQSNVYTSRHLHHCV